jgi:hypothetical protein
MFSVFMFVVAAAVTLKMLLFAFLSSTAFRYKIKINSVGSAAMSLSQQEYLWLKIKRS